MQKDIVVVDGYVTFGLTHCSTYVLTTKEVKAAGSFPTPGEGTGSGDKKETKPAGIKSVVTGDNAPVMILIIAAIAAVIVSGVLIWRKVRR